MYLEFRYCFQSHCLKMPFPIHVTVTLEKEGTFSCPPEEFRGKMSAALKDYFSEKLEEEQWSDPVLCGAANPPLQGEENDAEAQKHSR